MKQLCTFGKKGYWSVMDCTEWYGMQQIRVVTRFRNQTAPCGEDAK